MIRLGEKQKLTVVKRVEFGVYLAEDAGAEERVLLPGKRVPEQTKEGDEIEVFIYKDSKDRIIATTAEPKLKMGEYTPLRVVSVQKIGAFLDYPIDDVKCFIEKDGKDSLFSGYWKVYNNPGKAKMIFGAYDKAKTNAVNEYLVGKTIRDIAYVAA